MTDYCDSDLLQLEDGHSLFDYNVGLNAIVQVVFRPEGVHAAKGNTEEKSTENGGTTDSVEVREANGECEVGQTVEYHREYPERISQRA